MDVAVKCKRIIDGKTYNTETATEIASWSEDGGPHIAGEHLFQNRFGAFFLFHYIEASYDYDHTTITPFTPEQGRAWLERRCGDRTDLIETLFGVMPEAGAGEVKYTLRMPESLKDRLALRAKVNSQSLNAWIVRCLETCAAPTEPTIKPLRAP